jgi:hypothetical protein
MDSTTTQRRGPTPDQIKRGYFDPDAGKSEAFANQPSPVASPPERCIEEHLRRASENLLKMR